MSAAILSRDTTGSRVEPVVDAHGRFAAILDLENIAIVDDRRVSQAEMKVLLSAIQAQVFGMQVRVASGVHVLRAYMNLMDLQRWGLTLVKTEPDAADKALCVAAHEFVRSGATDIVVVSGDGKAFAPLAAHARVHVISHPDHLSKALRLAATTVTHLPTLRPSVRAAG